MVNPVFMQNLLGCINKELKGMLAGPPAVWPGGVEMDHYKGLASALAVRIVPFMKETYQATEFVFGAIPVNNAIVPRMYFQCAVLNVGGKNVPGVGNFGAVVRAPVPETYVAPYADWKYRLLPLSAFTGEDVDRPVYDFKDLHEVFFTLAAHVIAHPMPGPDVGNLYLNEGNAAMMDLMTKAVNVAAGPPAGATPAQGPPQ